MRLSEAAQSGNAILKRFFENTPGVSYDQNTGTCIVNPSELAFKEGNA